MFIFDKKRFKFGTKAETLAFVDSFSSSFHIPLFHHFNLLQWGTNKEEIINHIQSIFGNSKIIVRSSACGEDAESSSMAGLFISVPNIFADDRDMLAEAIEQVSASYKKILSQNDGHQILVQKMVEGVSMSGVIFTQDLNTGAPYYVINYDDETGKTDTVTSGKEHSDRTLLVHRGSIDELKSERFRVLLNVAQEIEQITGHDSLDIEFAVDRENRVHIFQVRQIATRPNWNRGITIKINDSIKRMKSFLGEKQKKNTALYGSCPIFTTMSDWNPAEMIGTSPRPLSLSLYKYLITNFAWREARKLMGYFEPRGTKLMVDFCGRPYIDVRLSFNSFLPNNLPKSIATKLVDAWLTRLSENKELHDKVEFDIVTTALCFDFDERVRIQFPHILDENELDVYKKSLFELTNNLITGQVTPIEGELQKIELLARRRSNIASLSHSPDLATVSALLEDCISLGTIPFSILARHAFVATSFLKSLTVRGVLDEDEISLFQKSIKTVTSDFLSDINLLTSGNIDSDFFMEKYGHLRPGTYDILSRRYDQREELLGRNVKIKKVNDGGSEYVFSEKKLNDIQRLLLECKYNITPEELISYIKRAIAAREYSKFIFTENISDALEIIAAWGEKIGLSRDEISYINITDILDSDISPKGRTLEHYLRELSLVGKEEHEVTSSLKLPYLIENSHDISIVPLLVNRANFITRKVIKAPLVFVDGRKEVIPDLSEKIVVIEGADPGFDWIFSHPIKGLITKYGGANSHMAIRCAEFGLPAAIGCGEQTFDRILNSRVIELNCSEERIEPIEI